MKSIGAFFIAVIVSCVSATSLAESPADALVKKLTMFDSVVGKAVQTITTVDGEVVQKTESEFKILRPGYFFWRTLPPYEQVIVSNPKTLSVYDPDLEQVSIYDANKMQNSPASILSGDKAVITSRFSVAQSETKKKREVFELQYLDANNADFKTLKLAFKKGELESITLIDMLDQTTQIEFKKIQASKELTPLMFEFIPPEGVDVIVE